MLKKSIPIFLFLYLCICLSLFSQTSLRDKYILVTKGDSTYSNLNKYLYILEDSTNNIEFSQIIGDSNKHKFTSYRNYKKANTRFTRNKTYWAKLVLKNQSDRNHWILYAGRGSLLELHYRDENGVYRTKINGSLVAGRKRDVKTFIVESLYKFNVLLKPNKPVVFYLKIQGKFYNPRYALKLQNSNIYESEESYLIIIQSIFQGALWIIILYNIILFLIVKDKTYLFYVFYVLMYSLYYLGYYDFLNNYPYTQVFVAMLSSEFSLVFYFLFMQLFVNAKVILGRWNKVINTWIIIKLIFVFGLFIFVFNTLNLVDVDIFLLAILLVDVIFFIVTFIFLVKSKSILARYFVIGSFLLMLGWALSVLSFFGLITVDQNENYFSQGGLFLELVLFSVGLGYRERKNEQEKRLAQEENARILKEQNVTLERKVKERTIEITEKNEELMVQKEEILTQRDALQERGEELQFAYNQITDSVRYAQTIQNAILPFEQKIKRVFEDYFIIFYPKDIVSGDFYWFNTIDDSEYPKAVVSAIDCTGHGVPGAFMSMIGNTLLNETINEKRIFDPAEVLTRLHDKIRQDLRQAETNNSDGMDMALCVVEQMPDQNYKLTFSGAKRPLYYIHEGELEQLKADRFSIGGEVYEDERERIFTNKEIILNKGDMFYMLTDGFGDTPGMDRKRFGSRNIKKMISAAKDLSMPDQKENFEQTLANHMGDQEARDDVTFLGFKI